MDKQDLKCCGNCYYTRDDTTIKKCLDLVGSYSFVCDNWEHDQKTYDDRKKEAETEQGVRE